MQRDPSWKVDPVDGQAKVHFANVEKDLRVYVASDGVWSAEERTDAAAFRTDVLLDGFEPAGAPVLGDDGVSLAGDGVSQSWFNTPRGIEHAMTVEEPRSETDEIVLTLRIAGLSPRSMGPHAVALVDEAGRPRVYYRGLAAVDANNCDLPAWMLANADTVEVHVLVGDAAWPVTVDPLTETAVTRVGSGTADSEFGYQVATGFINNDSFPDVLVGAPTYVSGGLHVGAVEWYFGSSGGIGATAQGPRVGTVSGVTFGDSVALGDVDGDGDDDILVGAANASSTGFTEDGTVSIYRNDGSGGFASLPNRTLTAQLDGCHLGGTGGLVVANVDDTGAKDVVARCEGANNTIMVWFGVTGAPNGAPDITSDVSGGAGVVNGQGLAVGDVNADLIPDIVVPGIQGALGGQVLARIFLGSNSFDPSTDTPIDVDLTGVADAYPCAALVDIDGDTYDDLVIGDPNANSLDGTVAVYMSAANGSGPDSTADAAFDGNPGTAEGLGGDIGGADVNADGYGDVVMCADFAGSGDEGRCVLYSGSLDGLETDATRWEVAGANADDELGGAQGAVVFADLTGDGANDVIVGEPLFGPLGTGTGQVLIYDGDPASLRTPSAAQIQSNVAGEQLGGPDYDDLHGGPRLAIADMNGDGIGDLIAGAPSYDNGNPNDGAVFIWLGATGTTFNSTFDWHVYGSSQGKLGSALAVGHFHGASNPPSVAVSEPQYNSNEGQVLTFQAGAHALPSTTPTMVIAGSEKDDAFEFFGTALAACGNLINSSGDCLAIGSAAKGGGTTTTGGSVYVHASLGSSGLSSSIAASRSGTANGTSVSCDAGDERFGAYVANAGPVDHAGNGTDDLLVGYPDCDDGETDEGAVFLYTGASGGSLTASSFTFENNSATSSLGEVAGIGDVNGDGIADFAMGAPRFDNGISDVGRIYIVYGSTGTPGSPAATYTSTSASRAGASIAGAGDVNHDGVDDFVEGEPFYSGSFTNEGKYCLFFGKAGGIDMTPDFCRTGGGTSFFIGSTVAMGDLNGDDRADVVIGAAKYTNVQSNEGRLTVVVGQW